MKIIRNISRLFIGFVFLFSGFVKAVDPLGSQYKIEDYLTAFGMDFSLPIALAAGILLSTVEFALGFCLIANAFTRFVSWIVLGFMSFFTVLTFILALYNPVSDCGCFGDAIILTNWETFFKNIIFMLPTLIIFLHRNKFKSNANTTIQAIQTAFIIITGVFTSIYSYNNLPIIDFRPYKVGQNIFLASKLSPNGAPQAIFETTLLYEKNGETQAFGLNNLPDTTWKWKETINKETAVGYTPPIKDFYLSNEYGDNATNILLNRDEMVLMAFVQDIEKLTPEQIEFYNHIYVQCLTNDVYFTMITSSSIDKIKDFEVQNLIPYKFYNIDPIALKTIVRAEGGLMLTYKGTILKKWHPDNMINTLKLNEYELISEAINTAGHAPLKQTMWYLLLFTSIALFSEWLILYFNKNNKMAE